MMRRLAIIAGIALFCAGVGFGQDNQSTADFYFKRIGVPTTGDRSNRITIQIQPEKPGINSSDVEQTVTTGTELNNTMYDWFWTQVPPERSASVPGRLILGIDALRNAPVGQEVTGPTLAVLTKIAQTYGRDILINTVGTDVSPALVLSVISVESAGDHQAISRAGAQGLMQLMPATAARFDVSNAIDPVQNIRGGVAYLDWLMQEFDKDPVLFLAAYNAGEGSVRDADGVPNYPETRAYVPKVLAAWTVALALCVTPPELMSDGCVFSINGD